MPDRFEDSTALLQRLVAEVIKKTTDSEKYDELCIEIWRVLAERERLKEISPPTRREASA